MSELLVSEQILLTGNVDIPYSNDNLIKLIQLFGSDNYIPSVVQEVSTEGAMVGRPQNRICLTDNRGFLINLFSNRIQVVRAPMPGKEVGESFITLASRVLGKIASSFDLTAGRCIVAKEKMMPEADVDKIERVGRNFLPTFANGGHPYEWFVRNAFVGEESFGKTIDIFEVSRARGEFIQDGVSKNFERVRFKTEVATDVENEAPRFDIRSAPEILQILWGISEKRLESLEGIYREA